MPTRRDFILETSVLAATVLTPMSALAWPRDSARRSVGIQGIACEDFQRCVGTDFIVQDQAQVVAILRLAAVDRHLTPSARMTTPDAGYEKFSLQLAGSSENPLSQDTYGFVHGMLGRFEMFIVPLASLDPAVILYEAIFNRARTSRFLNR